MFFCFFIDTNRVCIAYSPMEFDMVPLGRFEKCSNEMQMIYKVTSEFPGVQKVSLFAFMLFLVRIGNQCKTNNMLYVSEHGDA